MKMRVLSLLLCLCMAVSLLAGVTVSADEAVADDAAVGAIDESPAEDAPQARQIVKQVQHLNYQKRLHWGYANRDACAVCC